MNISGKRWNELINAVNNNISENEVIPPIKDAEELKIFREMSEQLQKLREKNPNASFSPVEIEFDDECLDIYEEEDGQYKTK